MQKKKKSIETSDSVGLTDSSHQDDNLHFKSADNFVHKH